MLEVIALGEMGLTLDYFYSMTPREFGNALEGFRMRQQDEFRNGWEQTRDIMFAALAPHQKKNANLTPEKVKRLPWDKNEADLPVLTSGDQQEKLKEGVDTWARIDANRAAKK